VRWLFILFLFLAGCAHLPLTTIDTSRLAGEYWNGDGFWPRSLDLKSDGTFSYNQMTDTMRMIDDDHFEFDGSWTLSGHWNFVPPDRIEMSTNGKPEKITVFVRSSKKYEFAILEPDMFADILSTWSDDGSLRYLKKKKNPPNQALQHNDPSCHGSCLRTPRASWGRG